ncbi:MAG: hypothetical protein ACEPOV_09395 [Hyphomicrobiales bacterium]
MMQNKGVNSNFDPYSAIDRMLLGSYRPISASFLLGNFRIAETVTISIDRVVLPK